MFPLSGPHLTDPRAPIYALPEPELIAELRRLNGMKAEVLDHPELLELMLPVVRADLRVVQAYTHSPEGPLATPVTAYGGRRDPDIGSDALGAWRAHTLARVDVKLLPGDRFFLHTCESALLDDVAQRLRTCVPYPAVMQR